MKIDLPMLEDAQVEAIEKVYASIPGLKCKRKCQSYCSGIAFSRGEAQYLLTSGKKLPVADSTMSPCSHLLQGQCGIYRHRPLICRIWGVARSLKCPHGCRPDRWLGDDEVLAMIKKIDEICGIGTQDTVHSTPTAPQRGVSVAQAIAMEKAGYSRPGALVVSRDGSGVERNL